MPSTEQILGVIANEEKPLHRNKIAEKLGETSYRSFQTMLDRAVKNGLLKVSGEHEYSITEEGEDELKKKSEVTTEISDESLGTTEYQKFISLGKTTGILPPELLKQTADHIWNGGDYRDLDWVAKGMKQMGVRQDLISRFWHSWRTYLQIPFPGELPEEIKGISTSGDKNTKKDTKEKGIRAYIIDEDEQPIFVGEGNGNLDYQDAVDLARIRAARSRVAAGATSQSSMIEDITAMFSMFKEMMGLKGEKVEGKSYVVSPGENGMQVQEIEQGKPLIISSPQGEKQSQNKTLFVNNRGELVELEPGKPIIIQQQTPGVNNPGVRYLIDKSTGQYEKIESDAPIIIQTTPIAQNNYPYSPIQMKDSEGNPMVLDLSTFIRLEEHRDKQKREDDSHQVKMDIAKSFKDLLTKFGNAVTNAGE
jgi:predicted transcriptional regulator